MKIKMILFSLIFSGCSVVGYRTTEEPEYQVVKKEKSFEIREYEPIMVAEVATQGDYEESSKKGFNKLAKYIFGENISQEKIGMTVPVFQEKNGGKISMTAPVIQEKTNEGWIMRFTMPARYTFETLPMPIDKDIKIVMSESKKMAVITYTGILTGKKIESNTVLLREWLIKNGYKELSPPQSAGYDPPWTIPFLRKNEVQIEIESK
ncbi:MAG: SOUL family heme-binding protein [Fusobacteriaceae bacterium]